MAKTILVIEDDPAILQLAGDILGLSGYHVELATDGLEGIRRAQHIHPDLVLLDWMLPTVDGLEVARQLRQDPTSRAIPIVLMSGKDPAHVSGGSYDAFVAKPFRVGDLLQVIDHYITE